MMTETILAGFGGQGILFAGKMLAYFGLMDNKEVSWLPSYGPEMRGGTANCSVCISDDAVGSPLVTEPDVLIVMNGPSYDKFINDVKPGGIAIIDSTLIETKCTRDDIKCFYVPSTQMAEEQGLKGMANIILIGKLIKETGIASDEVIRKALEKIIPPAKAQLIDKNLKAISLGMEV
ncbi:MAG: 2-oxoacid:acceptor oxidoreductase family protein [Oscillospiraceae bacterium]|nr:2-oxoacid:acceptor oxidoreductase family protein [Oscillospiraceae bacterium]